MPSFWRRPRISRGSTTTPGCTPTTRSRARARWEYAAAHGLVWAPSVGPGYVDDRAVPGNTTPTLGRDGGATYDLEWNNALDPDTGGVPTWVTGAGEFEARRADSP